jgi:hypothetical protein
MQAPALSSSLRTVLRKARVDRYPPLDERAIITDLQEACTRLTSRLDGRSLDRGELIAISTDLEPVARRLLRLRKSLRAKDGYDHAIRLLDIALQDIDTCLYYSRPWRPYVWPGALQSRLWHVQNSLSHALIALRWASINDKQ